MFIDFHTHILCGVDDGSKDIDTSLLMLEEAMKEDIHIVFLTPHMQSRVQKVERSIHYDQFKMLQDEVTRRKLPIKLYLGAEVLYRTHLTPDYQSLTLGSSRYLLIEFSMREENPIEEVVYDISRMGFIPIVAHIERYPYLKYEDYQQIKSTGALIQVNTTSILGLDKAVKSKNVIKMIKEGLVDVIATDAHNLDVRKPNLKTCYTFLKKHVNSDVLDQIFFENPKKIMDAMSQ